MRTLIHTDEEAISRLEQLGLEDGWIRRALLRGNAECRTVSPLAPKGFEGVTRWGRSAEYFREEMCSREWIADDFQNVAQTISPDGTFCIVVTTGSKGTGVEGSHPTTKYPKGSGTAACVESNYMIDFAPEDLRKMGISPAAGQAITTWLLLFSVEGNVMFAELSLPDSMSDDGHIANWRERIIFPPIDLGPTVFPEDDTGPSDPVEVPVTRR